MGDELEEFVILVDDSRFNRPAAQQANASRPLRGRGKIDAAEKRCHETILNIAS